MSEVLPLLALTVEEARALTDEVRADAALLWTKMLQLYRGGAHTTLGYASWSAYCSAEFDLKKSTAYRLVHAGQVIEALESEFPAGNWKPITPTVARELAPLSSEPGRMAEILADARTGDGSVTPAAIKSRVLEAMSKPPTATRPKSAARPKGSFLAELEAASEDTLARSVTTINVSVADKLSQLVMGVPSPLSEEQVALWADAAREALVDRDQLREAGAFVLRVVAAMG